jgi:hypothetical protein
MTSRAPGRIIFDPTETYGAPAAMIHLDHAITVARSHAITSVDFGRSGRQGFLSCGDGT